jgi:predicted small secreted protein
MKKILVLVVSMLLLNACNTMQGMGKDVQRAGSAVERAAK